MTRKLEFDKEYYASLLRVVGVFEMNRRFSIMILVSLIMIVCSQIYVAHAWEIDDYSMCKDTMDLLPVRRTNEFYITDTEVNFWFHIILDEPADIKLRWIKPNGDTYHTTKWDPFDPGNWNSAGTLFIEDSDVTERYLGQEWEAELYVNDELAAFETWVILDTEAMAARLEDVEDDYYNLTDSFDELLAISLAQDELLTMFEEDYESIQGEYDSLLTDYTQIEDDYNELLDDYDSSQAEIDRLNDQLDSRQGIPGFPISSIIIGIMGLLLILNHLKPTSRL